MKKTSLALVVLSFLIATVAMATPTPKYTGAFEFAANTMHKDGVKGQMQLLFEGDQFVQVFLKSDKPVYGKTDFPSSEQIGMTSNTADLQRLAVVFKLKGPTHKWYYVYVGDSSDMGKSFAGAFYKALATIDEIKNALNSNTIPTTWNLVGKATLAAQ